MAVRAVGFPLGGRGDLLSSLVAGVDAIVVLRFLCCWIVDFGVAISGTEESTRAPRRLYGDRLHVDAFNYPVQ